MARQALRIPDLPEHANREAELNRAISGVDIREGWEKCIELFDRFY